MIFRCFTTTVWILILITILIVGGIYSVVLHLIGVMGLHPLYSRIFTGETKQSIYLANLTVASLYPFPSRIIPHPRHNTTLYSM